MPTNVLDERLATEEKRKFMTQHQINGLSQLDIQKYRRTP
jgi:hypothetical protein